MNEIVFELSPNGEFYNVFGENAVLMSEIFGFKLFTHYRKSELAVGFPSSSLSYVKNKLDKMRINYYVNDKIDDDKIFDNNKKETISDDIIRVEVNDIVELRRIIDSHMESFRIIEEHLEYVPSGMSSYLFNQGFIPYKEKLLTKGEPEKGVILNTTKIARCLLGKTVGDNVILKDYNDNNELVEYEYTITEIKKMFF